MSRILVYAEYKGCSIVAAVCPHLRLFGRFRWLTMQADYSTVDVGTHNGSGGESLEDLYILPKDLDSYAFNVHIDDRSRRTSVNNRVSLRNENGFGLTMG